MSCDRYFVLRTPYLHEIGSTHIIEYFIVNVRLYNYTHFKGITCTLIYICEDSSSSFVIHSVNPYNVNQPIQPKRHKKLPAQILHLNIGSTILKILTPKHF
jgi:hypothetical protein